MAEGFPAAGVRVAGDDTEGIRDEVARRGLPLAGQQKKRRRLASGPSGEKRRRGHRYLGYGESGPGDARSGAASTGASRSGGFSPVRTAITRLTSRLIRDGRLIASVTPLITSAIRTSITLNARSTGRFGTRSRRRLLSRTIRESQFGRSR